MTVRGYLTCLESFGIGIINGAGNYYIESRTRDHGRTDVVVDYHGKQYVIEIKIWRGNE